MEYDSAMKKKEILPFVMAMDGLWGHQVKWSKSEKDNYSTVSLMWVI